MQAEWGGVAHPASRGLRIVCAHPVARVDELAQRVPPNVTASHSELELSSIDPQAHPLDVDRGVPTRGRVKVGRGGRRKPGCVIKLGVVRGRTGVTYSSATKF